MTSNFYKYLVCFAINILALYLSCKKVPIDSYNPQAPAGHFIALYPIFEETLNIKKATEKKWPLNTISLIDSLLASFSIQSNKIDTISDPLLNLTSEIERINYHTTHILDSSLTIFQEIKKLIKNDSSIIYKKGIASTFAYMECIERNYEGAERIVDKELQNLSPHTMLDSIYYLKLLLLKAYSHKQQGWAIPIKLSEAKSLYDDATLYYLKLSKPIKLICGPIYYFEKSNYAAHLKDSILLAKTIAGYYDFYSQSIKPMDSTFLWMLYNWNKGNNKQLLNYSTDLMNKSKELMTHFTSYQFHSIYYQNITGLVNDGQYNKAINIANKISNECFNSNLDDSRTVLTPFYFVLLDKLHEIYYKMFLKSRSRRDLFKANKIFDDIKSKIERDSFYKDAFRKIYFYNITQSLLSNQSKLAFVGHDDLMKKNIHRALNKYSNMILNEVSNFSDSKPYERSIHDSLKAAIIEFHLLDPSNLLKIAHLGDSLIYFEIQNIDTLIPYVNSIRYELNRIPLSYTTKSIQGYGRNTFKLYGTLFAPILNKLTNFDTFYLIVNDTLFNSLPFGFFVDDTTRLCEAQKWSDLTYFQHKVSVVYSFNYFKLRTKLSASQKVDTGGLIILYDKSGYQNLLHTKEEMNSIASYFAKDKVLKIDFNRIDELKSLDKFSSIHIIGHGKQNSSSLFDTDIKGNSGLLNYQNLKDKLYNNKKITLSICSSSSGYNSPREGNISIIHGLISSNAKYVIGTISESSDYFLKVFYENFYNIHQFTLVSTFIKISKIDSRLDHPAYLSSIRIYT